ncbi:Crp/Fnr family transcriptional regulator [Maritimibacter sp. 55A14]|uniref:Crp/Fnr family transcriptional regulator n=1 Tax=Maritimibacter sp. 55A14 TaxID=2174844 RepID=UPI000D619360|nr:Crp/Fnr family transcriptional regulator [Maritimibacter sp. 55A14]PWE31425.1 Crp/Fnr family transcriptional regulator [Maritimibacter sp. 55A14]
MTVTMRSQDHPVPAQPQIPLLLKASGTARQTLADLLQRGQRTYLAGTGIAHEGGNVPAFIWLQHGWVALSKSLADGQCQTIDIVLPGDAILAASGDGWSSTYGIDAVTEVKLSVIDAASWQDMLTTSPDLSQYIARLTAAAEARRAERMLRLGRGSASVRVAYLLLELCARLCARNCHTEHAYHVPLTQHQIGDLTGLSSVHVCRILRRLAREGMIETSDHTNVVIHDREALSAVADLDFARLLSEILPAEV